MKPRKKYTEEDLQNALEAINNGSSVYKVSRQYNIPETTLRDKRDNKYIGHIPGRKTVLSKSEETKIVDWIHYLGKQGFPVSKDQLKQGVAKLVENLNRPFKNGIPKTANRLDFEHHVSFSRPFLCTLGIRNQMHRN